VLEAIRRMFTTDLAMDLGTANTLVFVQGAGIVIDEPSIVAVTQRDHEVLAVGHEAKAMIGRTPASLSVIRPMKGGVIADLDVAQKLIRHFIVKALGRYRTRLGPRVVIGVPYGITPVERRAVRDSAIHAGAREVYLMEEPTAAAIGAGMPITEPGGNMVLTIGGGTTEVAVISMSGIVYCESARTAGDEMDEAITQYVRKHYSLLIGERQAEAIKLGLGSACQTPDEPREMTVKGRHLIEGIPQTITVKAEEVRDALRDCVAVIVETVRTCLERTPPELAADIIDKGIVMTGGGALLRGLDQLMKEETSLPVQVAPNPLSCVALGTGKVLDELALLRKVALAS
jgi:rod shape-determining protein MreB